MKPRCLTLLAALVWGATASAAVPDSHTVTIVLQADASLTLGADASITVGPPYTPQSDTSTATYTSVAAGAQTITVGLSVAPPLGTHLTVDYQTIGGGGSGTCSTSLTTATFAGGGSIADQTVVSGISNATACTATVLYTLTVDDISQVPPSAIGSNPIVVTHTLSE